MQEIDEQLLKNLVDSECSRIVDAIPDDVKEINDGQAVAICYVAGIKCTILVEKGKEVFNQQHPEQNAKIEVQPVNPVRLGKHKIGWLIIEHPVPQGLGRPKLITTL